MNKKIEGKGLQQVRLAGWMACGVLLTWGALTLFFIHGQIAGRAQGVGDAAYAALQLFFANLGFEAFENVEAPFDKLLLGMRYIVPWLITLLALLAFVDSLRIWLWLKARKFSAFLGRNRPLIVIVGLGEKGLAMVNAERARHKAASIVVIEQDPDNMNIAIARSAGATVWVGNALSQADLQLCCWKRPKRIFALTGSDELNLLVVQLARKLHDQRSNRPGTQRVDVYALINDVREKNNLALLDMFNHDSAGFWTHPINFEEDAAAYLLGQFPVLPFESRRPRVLVLGGGQLGYALVVELLKQGHFMRRGATLLAPEIVVVDRAPEETARFDALKARLQYAREHQIGFASLETVEADVLAWGYDDYVRIQGLKAFSHVFVTLGSEGRNLAITGKVCHWEKLANGGRALPKNQILTISYEEGDGLLDKPPEHFSIFSLKQIYSARALHWQDEVRRRACRLNACYAQIFSEDQSQKIILNRSSNNSDWVAASKGWMVRKMQDMPPAGEDALWTATRQVDRNSSLDQVRHLTIKMHELGIEPGLFEHEFNKLIRDPAIFRDMAETEHRRWNAAMLLAGYVLGERKDKSALVHPSLKPFDDLDAEIQCYDFALLFNIGKIFDLKEMNAP